MEETISTEAKGGNRKAAEDYILRLLNMLMPGGKSVEVYRDMFKKMSDKEFDKFMHDLKDDKITLVLIVPNFRSKGLSIARNLDIARKEFNYDFFQR